MVLATFSPSLDICPLLQSSVGLTDPGYTNSQNYIYSRPAPHHHGNRRKNTDCKTILKRIDKQNVRDEAFLPGLYTSIMISKLREDLKWSSDHNNWGVVMNGLHLQISNSEVLPPSHWPLRVKSNSSELSLLLLIIITLCLVAFFLCNLM